VVSVEPEAAVRYGTPRGWWVIVTMVLGSGMAFLDGTVVSVALPAIAKQFGTGLAGLQWTVTAYLLTLGSLLLVGGALGDRYGRRKVFVIGWGCSPVRRCCAGWPRRPAR